MNQSLFLRQFLPSINLRAERQFSIYIMLSSLTAEEVKNRHTPLMQELAFSEIVLLNYELNLFDQHRR